MRRLIFHLVAFALYAGLAILLTWPLAAYVTAAVPGNAFDSWQNMWNMWWLRTALLEGVNPYFTPMLYHPQGTSLLLQTLNPINFLTSLPVHFFFGLTAAYNFAILLNLTLSGFVAYLLAIDVTGDRRAALIGGVIFATSGYLLAQVLGGHTHMTAAWPLPLAVLTLRYAYRRPTLVMILVAGAALALNMLADWQYFLFALIWAGWYALWMLFAPGTSQMQAQSRASGVMGRISAILPLVGAVVVALVLTSPLIIATARTAAVTPTAATEGGPDFRREQSVDLADLVIPSQIHPVWGSLAEQAQAYKANTHIQNKTAYLGLIALILGLLGLRGRESLFWLVSMVLFIALAMGPVFQIAGWNSGVPLPSALLFELPLVGIFRYPMRFMALAMLALAMLAAYGTLWLLTGRHGATTTNSEPRKAQRRSGIAAWILLPALIVLLVLDNLTVPFPIVGIYIPSIYHELAADPDDFAILEAPFYYTTSPFYMLYQVIHEKPLVGGYTSRRMPYTILEELPLIRMFAYAEPAPDIIAQDMPTIAASVFDYFDIRYVMLHSAGGALQNPLMEEVAQAAAGEAEPRREGATFVASDARSASGLLRPLTLGDQQPAGAVLTYRVVPPSDPLPFLGIGEGWEAPEVHDAQIVRTMQADAATIVIYSAKPRQVTLTMTLTAPAAQNLQVAIGATTLTTIPLEAGRQTVQVPLDLEAGKTEVVLRTTTSGTLQAEEVDLMFRSTP